LPRWLGNVLFGMVLSDRRTPNAPSNCAHRLTWQSLSGGAPTQQIGSKSAALTSVSRWLRRNSACVPLSSINRSKSRLCARSSLSGSLGSRRPDLVLRFGRGPQLPHSLRRPVADVIV